CFTTALANCQNNRRYSFVAGYTTIQQQQQYKKSVNTMVLMAKCLITLTLIME
ncbi:unnamed protein product, partial [Ceratitis capitata]